MQELLDAYKDESDDREKELEILHSDLPPSGRYLSPPGRRPVAEVPNLHQDSDVEQ